MTPPRSGLQSGPDYAERSCRHSGGPPSSTAGLYFSSTKISDVWTSTCWRCQYSIQTREHLFKNYPQWRSQQKTLWTTVLKETRKLPGPTRGRYRTSIAELLADERCSQAVLKFLATTDVGRTSGPPVAEAEEDAASEASEWEARDQAERAWERREEEERLGAE